MTRGSADVVLGLPVNAAWAAVVSPQLHGWYYRQTPQGRFATGEKILWIDATGSPSEESEVVEISAPNRLVMRTRYLFSATFAEQEPHTLTWEVARHGKGSCVRLSWDANAIVAGLLESEAGNILDGLRLEHDPAAQAEIARKPAIGKISIEDVTPERVGDYQSFFDHVAFRDYPAWRSCYCMEPHRTQTGEEWAVRTAADNRRDMTSGIEEKRVTALLAYVDGKPVGWCNYGETARLNGLVLRFGLDAGERKGVGSLACFLIAAPYREHGVATALLTAALDRLRAQGMKIAEAYPVKELKSPQSNYRGPLSMYTAAGFEPYRETEGHLIVRKTL